MELKLTLHLLLQIDVLKDKKIQNMHNTLELAFMLSLLGIFAGFIGKIIASEQILNYIIAAILFK